MGGRVHGDGDHDGDADGSGPSLLARGRRRRMRMGRDALRRQLGDEIAAAAGDTPLSLVSGGGDSGSDGDDDDGSGGDGGGSGGGGGGGTRGSLDCTCRVDVMHNVPIHHSHSNN